MKTQKILATSLAATLATSMVGTPAFADETSENYNETPVVLDETSLDGGESAQTEVVAEVDAPMPAPVSELAGEGSDQMVGEDQLLSTASSDSDDRDVDVSFSDITVDQTDVADYDFEGLDLENYEGKQLIQVDNNYANPSSSLAKRFHKHTYVNDEGEQEVAYYPIVNRTQEEYDLLPDSIKVQYSYDEAAGVYAPTNATNSWNAVDNGVPWDFIFTNTAEIALSGNVHIVRGSSDTGQSVASATLNDKAGNRVFAYCMDAEKSTSIGALYTVENIESADYFAGTPEEQAEAKQHVRAAVQKGYWGTESGVGSLDQLKKDLKAALNDGMSIEFSFMGRENGTNNAKEFTYSSDENLAELLAMVDSITEGEAMNATQAAIWAYGNHKGGTVDDLYLGVSKTYSMDDGVTKIINTSTWDGTQEEYDEYNRMIEARMELIRSYLLSDYLKDKVADEGSGTTIITETTFIDEDSLSLVVGERAKGMLENKDDNLDNDIYSADLSFGLLATPTSNDELIVSLVDADGNVIRQAHIGKNEASNGDDFFCKDGIYTFKGVQLSENADVDFNLTMEGLQQLEQGVYMFMATGGTASKQTLVGLFQGMKEVDVTSAFTLRFNVDEPYSDPDEDLSVSGDDDPLPGDNPDSNDDGGEGDNPGEEGDNGEESDQPDTVATLDSYQAPVSAETQTESQMAESPATSDFAMKSVVLGLLAAVAASVLALRISGRKA